MQEMETIGCMVTTASGLVVAAEGFHLEQRYLDLKASTVLPL